MFDHEGVGPFGDPTGVAGSAWKRSIQ